MDDSSDESFTWAHTSNDTEDEDIEKLKMNKVKQEKENSLLNEELVQKSVKKNKKHRESNNFMSPDQKHIKTEPESDVDVKKKKKKHKSGSHRESQGSSSYDESFLDLQVKHENTSFVVPESVKVKKIKKEKKADYDVNVNIDLVNKQSHSINESNEDELDDSVSGSDKSSSKKKKKKKKSKLSESYDSTFNNEDESVEQTNTFPKKSKKKKHKSVSEDSMEVEYSIEDKFCPEETIVQLPRKLLSKDSKVSVKQNSSSDHLPSTFSSKEFVSDSSSSEDNCDEAKNNGNITNGPLSIRKNSDINKKSFQKVSVENSTVLDMTPQRKVRISDRLAFEEELDIDHNITNNHIEENKTLQENESMLNELSVSSNMKKYLKSHKKSRPVLQLSSENSLITENDEIWVMKCPKEVNIMSLRDKDIQVDEKCKIKVDSHTFEGHLDCEQDRVTLLLYKNIFLLNNTKINGFVHLRKKIPKPHFVEDNCLINNQTNFIPLPDTKCRHPLFGAHYKKAIKVPATIADRLKPLDTELLNNTKNKKKSKSKKSCDNHEENIHIEDNKESSMKKKKRKRKHSQCNDESEPKKTKLKHESDSADVWDSEKAVEQNLFNF